MKNGLKNIMSLTPLWLIGRVFIIFFIFLAYPRETPALEFMNGVCEYTKDELMNPDKVIELTLSGKKFCRGILLKQKLYQEINLPYFGKWPPVYPENSIRKLLKKYGLPKDGAFEPWGGIYRDYKVRGKKKHPPIDGQEALEYTVELLYIYLSGWPQVPNSGPYGLVPVCERSIVKLYAIKTNLGWYVKKPGPGDSLGHSLMYSNKKNTGSAWGNKGPEIDMDQSIPINTQCK